VTLPAPADVLRHGPEALLLERLETGADGGLIAVSRHEDSWTWPRMLEAAAQAAGLACGLGGDGLANTAVTAEYRDVRIVVPESAGRVVVRPRLERRILRFRRCLVEVQDEAARTLVRARITLAPATRLPDPLLDAPAADPRVYAILAESGFGPELFHERQHRACELVERYVLHQVLAIVDALGLRARLERGATPDALAEGLAAGFGGPLAWLVARLAADGLVTLDDDERPAPRAAGGSDASRTPDGARAVRAVRARGALPTERRPALRAAILALEPTYEPTLALLDETAAAWVKVARGEATGERALLSRLGLWARYFDNQNGYYALQNRVAAAAAAAHVRSGARLLEVGAGLGGAAAALLEALDATGRRGGLDAYAVTEPVDAFRRRAERELRARWPDLPLRFAALDVNQPWGPQGVAPASVDLLFGVNVFHLAVDLDAVLREAATALAPGGWLIVGEGFRPTPTGPVGAELPFQILQAFTAVGCDPVTRPTPGFLMARHWTAALARAGLADVGVVPGVERMAAIAPRLYAGAVCGRRPSATVER